MTPFQPPTPPVAVAETTGMDQPYQEPALPPAEPMTPFKPPAPPIAEAETTGQLPIEEEVGINLKEIDYWPQHKNHRILQYRVSTFIYASIFVSSSVTDSANPAIELLTTFKFVFLSTLITTILP